MTRASNDDEMMSQDMPREMVEAAAWRVRLTEAGLESSEEFEAWLSASALNANAWQRVKASWDFFSEHAIAPEVMRARREALDRAHAVHANRTRIASLPPQSSWQRMTRRAAFGAAAAVVALGIGLWSWNLPTTYSTALGERRILKLDDGSTVTLDSNSVLTVSLRRDARNLELRAGQARFDVAHDVARPFSVHAGSQTVVATGTSFNVDLLDKTVLVTLLQGHVSVFDGGKPRLAGADVPPRLVAMLDPGERVTSVKAASGGVPVASVVRGVSLSQATAWQSGKLIFSDEPLSLVAARVSRYSALKIAVDESAGSLKLSGVFDAGDASAFIDAVQQVLPVAAKADGKGIVHLARRAQ